MIKFFRACCSHATKIKFKKHVMKVMADQAFPCSAFSTDHGVRCMNAVPLVVFA